MKRSGTQALPAPIRRLRFIYVAALFTCWAVLVIARLVWLQLFDHAHYVQLAARQQESGFEVAPRRGVLYDRNLHALAVTVLVDSAYVVPKEFSDSERGVALKQTADALAKVVHTDPSDPYTSAGQIYARMNASHAFAWVARKLGPATVAKVKALNLKGVYFQKEFQRFYPNNVLAAQTLGYVSLDDNGLGGLESRFDDDLHGTPGHMLTAIDAKRHVLGSVEREPLPGENLVLSIDANIQYMAERALDNALAQTRALNGTVVVQDPHTGQILALAVRPTYNPNDFRHASRDVLQNRAVSDVYEPGSTFKLVTYSAAVDAAGVKPDDIVDCQGGAITLFGRTIHDDASDRGLGRIPVHVALEKSSDVGAVKMALKIGPEKFYQYMKGFGFGGRSGIELPSETRGLLRPPRKWGATSIGSLAIGQEVAVTPVQLVTMVSAIANGGVYLPPHLVLNSANGGAETGQLHSAVFRPGTEVPNPLPEGAHRVISTMTAAEMRQMMQGIVLFGTGKNAQLNGYSSGGKTGTAQKIDVATHTYSKTKHVASFAGFAPVNNPAISVAVILDSPQGSSYYGGAVSAPVFQEVAQQVLEYLGVPHDTDLKATRAATSEPAHVAEDQPPVNEEDLNGLYAALNELPADDPLKSSTANSQAVQISAAKHLMPISPVKGASEVTSDTRQVTNSVATDAVAKAFDQSSANEPATSGSYNSTPERTGSVVVNAGARVQVPDFAGKAVRSVLELASSEGLVVETLGSGVARRQFPAAGSMVPAGTEVVVRFTR